jgi:hypothetical protein
VYIGHKDVCHSGGFRVEDSDGDSGCDSEDASEGRFGMLNCGKAVLEYLGYRIRLSCTSWSCVLHILGSCFVHGPVVLAINTGILLITHSFSPIPLVLW